MYLHKNNLKTAVYSMVCFSCVSIPAAMEARELTEKYAVPGQKIVNNESAWHGEIKEIVVVKLKNRDFVTLLVAIGGDTKKVWLAPLTYLGSPFTVGEFVVIEGIEERVGKTTEIIAFRVIKNDGTVVSCRSEKGSPLWPKYNSSLTR